MSGRMVSSGLRGPSRRRDSARGKHRHPMTEDKRVSVRSQSDVVMARQQGREMAFHAGFSSGESAIIATVVSELARNIIHHAREGEIILSMCEEGKRRGIEVTARDEGPGIAEIKRALEAGYSTSRSLGLGLPGVKRLMDEFAITSEIGRGTVVTVKKWK